MVTCVEAIIEAFQELGDKRHISEIENWILAHYGDRWKSNTIATNMADMVPEAFGGNSSSLVRVHQQVLRRISEGVYCLK